AKEAPQEGRINMLRKATIFAVKYLNSLIPSHPTEASMPGESPERVYVYQIKEKLKLRAALAEKDKEIESLREALEPFALEYEARARLAPGPDIDHWPIGGSALTYRHIRIAYEVARNAGGN